MSSPATQPQSEPKRKAILGVGLKAGTDGTTQTWTADRIAANLGKVMQDATAAGYDIRPYLTDTHHSQTELEEHLASVTQLLGEKEWDGVAIGFGFRAAAELNFLFAGVLNAAVRVSGEKGWKVPLFVFPVTPLDMLDALRRTFGQEEGEEGL